VDLPRAADEGIVRALAVRAHDRFQSVAEMQKVLTRQAPAQELAPGPNGKSRNLRPVYFTLGVVVCLAMAYLLAKDEMIAAVTLGCLAAVIGFAIFRASSRGG
jgi:hypothetical protein